MLQIILYSLTALAALFVVYTLIAGAASMGKKDQASRERSNLWMQRRVIGQASAIILLILSVWVKKNGA